MLAPLAALAVIGAAIGVLAGSVMVRGRDSTTPTVYQFDTADFHTVAFAPDHPDLMYFGHHDGLWVSRDAGSSWEPTSLRGPDVMQLVLTPEGRWYAAGHEVFLVSTDAGRSWATPRHDLPGLDIHVFTAKGSRLYAAAVGHGLFGSNDGGTRWYRITLPPGGENGLVAMAVARDSPDHVYAGVGAQVAESVDGGRTWTTKPSPGGVVTTVAASADAALYVATDNGLWRLAGGRWEQLPLKAHGVVISVAVSPSLAARLAALDHTGRLYRSDDGGRSWVGD